MPTPFLDHCGKRPKLLKATGRGGTVFFPEQILTWCAELQGECLEVRAKYNYSQRLKGHVRDKTQAFSPASRLRLLKAIAHIDWQAQEKYLLVTLTYPDARRESTYRERTQHRYLFHRYIEKHLGRKVAVLWRTEWKVRQSGRDVGQLAPHTHLVLFGVPFLDQKKVRLWWRKILEVQGPLATDVRAANDGIHAARYVAKYVAKKDDVALDYAAYLNNAPGRPWGFLRKALIAWQPKEGVRGLEEGVVLMGRHLARIANPRHRGGGQEGFTIFGPAAKQIFARIQKSSLDTRAAQ